MKHHLLVFFIFQLFLHTGAFAQADSLQQQINREVWMPFIRAFNSLHTDSFMLVHSKAMTRVVQDKNRIYGYEQYYEETKRGNEKNRSAGRGRTIELRFIQRIASADRAFETGYYKTGTIQPDGKIKAYYGKFHVLLQKENGSWKILLDADASEKTDEQIFLMARPMEER